MAADKGEAYGIVWTPNCTPDTLQLPVTLAPRSGCYWYKARPGDYLSKVAWLAGIPLGRFMLENTDQVKDLDAPLHGKQLLLCKPKQGAYKVPGSNSTGLCDPQLEALLAVKASVDSAGVLLGWTRANGASSGYCKWKGVVCTKGTTSVYWINIGTGPGIQGLKGTLPPAAAFAGLSALTEVNISDQPGITGTLPADWSRMMQLQDIKLKNNSLTGSIPSTWSSLSKLQLLQLHTNKLSGRIPDSLGALTSLEDVGLQDNVLSGTIPDLSKLSKLKLLYLWQNNLSGRIPESLKVLTSLQTLDLSENALSGTLPAWLGGLSQLQLLNLHTNKLSGSIPSSLGRLTRLRFLYLGNPGLGGGNQLVGTLPDALKMLAALEEVDLAKSQLVGSVPRSWSSMRKLGKVWLFQSPQLEGCLPASWKQQLAGFDVEQWVYAGTNIKGFC
ncbi:hypothetical protein COO60DRAFT_907568 [Scenedesmus sp. NREL 46B-D3]|nr:hypothetical protein COO60DRAFT_907568 [Scenedesmus sp. NREL 46B-D3]